MTVKYFLGMAAALCCAIAAHAETTVYRDVRVFSNTGTSARWTVGETRPLYDGYDGYGGDNRPVYGGAVRIGRQNGRTSANVGVYFGNDRRHDHRPSRGRYDQGYRDGYRDGAYRAYRPYVQDNTTIVFDGGEDRYECKLSLYGSTYVARAHFRDIAQNRAHEYCTAARNSVSDCRNAPTRCESIW